MYGKALSFNSFVIENVWKLCTSHFLWRSFRWWVRWIDSRGVCLRGLLLTFVPVFHRWTSSQSCLSLLLLPLFHYFLRRLLLTSPTFGSSFRPPPYRRSPAALTNGDDRLDDSHSDDADSSLAWSTQKRYKNQRQNSLWKAQKTPIEQLSDFLWN